MKSLNTYIKQSYNDLYDYVYGYTTQITHRMRINRLKGGDKEIINSISSLMKEQKIDVLYRTIDWETMYKYWKITKNDALNSTYIDNGFVSTSFVKQSSLDFYKIKDIILLKITSKIPIKYIDINRFFGTKSPYPDQNEVLINKGYTYKINDVYKEGYYNVMDVEIIK